VTTLVLGVGNPDRGDDGVGARVVRLIGDRLPCRHVPADPASVIAAFAGHDEVVIVDASSTGAPPGTISTGLPVGSGTSPSTHGLGLAEALDLAAALGVMPPRLTVVTVEGGRFDHGADLSPEVELAAQQVAESLLRAPTKPF
jgi:hydrogenase maturation protease